MPETTEAHPLSGYEAMGHPVPAARMSAAYRAVKEMIPDITTEDAMTLVGRVAGAIERDEPYEAMRLATGAPIGRGTAAVTEPAPSDMPPVQLDVTGGYRLLAHLLA
jgi:hypothetical protein